MATRKRRKLRSDAGEHHKAKYRARKLPGDRIRVRCRCGRFSCQRRVTLPKHPGYYKDRPTCGACGAPLRVDMYRQLGETTRSTCDCQGPAHYPHRRGWCQKIAREIEAGER